LLDGGGAGFGGGGDNRGGACRCRRTKRCASRFLGQPCTGWILSAVSVLLLIFPDAWRAFDISDDYLDLYTAVIVLGCVALMADIFVQVGGRVTG
jgi:hypothetical protein